MLAAVLTTSAIFAASALAQGTAKVLNKCKYDVHLCNVPAAGGGYEQIDRMLAPDGSYEQKWTGLSNDQGWSIKLGRDAAMQDIMQYEYTFHNDGHIWYDLSEVNGNPWNGNWMITASPGCNPKQQAYRYSTDDAYGMQECHDSSDITVTLCSGESQDDAGAASASASVAAESSSAAPAPSSPYEAPTSEAPAPTTYAPAPTSTTEAAAAPTYGSDQQWGEHNNAVAMPVPTTSPTTFATSSTVVSADQYGVTVTEVATAVVTDIVTATAYAKRHAHHPRHPHQRHF